MKENGTTLAVLREISKYKSRRCWASQATIAEHLGISVRTVGRHLRLLLGAGRITIARRGLGLSNVMAPTSYAAVTVRKPCRVRSGSDRLTDKTYPRTSDIPKRASSSGDVSLNQNPPTGLSTRLIAAGISPGRAVALVRDYPEDAIHAQLRWLGYRGARDEGATLASAITQGWAEPPLAKAARLRDERRVAAQRADGEAAALDELSAAQARREDAAVATLSPSDTECLQSQARNTIDAAWPRFLPRGASFERAVHSEFRRSAAHFTDPERKHA